ncbi:MAG: GNAT family N-acetyltransferase [Anaerolineae bacterium]|nr:GNAT family N-acetyltransferase [Anaerolineae bacterium]
MPITRYHNAADFYRRAEAFLMQDEAEHNLSISICLGLIRDPERVPDAYFAVLESDGEISGTALCTPPFNLVLSRQTALDPLPDLVRDVAAVLPDLAGINAPVEAARIFAEQWTAHTGQVHHLELSERIYQLASVAPIKQTEGALRRVSEADRSLLREWLTAFEREALPNQTPSNPDKLIDQALYTDIRSLFLWEDQRGQPVTLVGCVGPTPHGIRIGPVYTPLPYRGKGYGSSATAALTRQLLEGGRTFCFLYTDLANPTSNHIYQQIGYQPVSDVDVYQFKN